MAKVDMITETMKDAIKPISDIFNEKNDAKKVGTKFFMQFSTKPCDTLIQEA